VGLGGVRWGEVGWFIQNLTAPKTPELLPCTWGGGGVRPSGWGGVTAVY